MKFSFSPLFASLCACTGTLLPIPCTVAHAQFTISEIRIEPAAEASEATPAAVAVASVPAPTPAPVTSPWLTKFQQLVFDRRESAILESLKQESVPAEATTPNAATTTAPPDPLAPELERFRRNVTQGKWKEVEEYLASMNQADADPSYDHLVQGLLAVPPPPPPTPEQQPPQPQFLEQHSFQPDDVVALADACPGDFTDERLQRLAHLMTRALSRGNFIDGLLARLETGSRTLGGKDPEHRKRAATLLIMADRSVEAGQFLPSMEEAVATGDREALNLLGRHFMALQDAEKTAENLEKAWKVTQAVLADEQVTETEKEEALERALELAPRVDESLGQLWLDESFTASPERGMEILTTIGALTSRVRHQFDPDVRFKKLELQNRAVEALLKVEGESAQEWQAVLNLLAMNWLREADYSRTTDQSDSMEPMLQWDQYGNMFYGTQQNQRNNQQPTPITTANLLEIQPSEGWQTWVEPSIQPRFTALLAQLYLKVNEPEKAFPFIEKLAQSHREQSLDLVHEFIDVWTRNHDPNQDNSRRSRYMYVYGYNERADTIPLTRSKQERNLAELAQWVTRLRALDVGDLDEKRLMKAFTTSHSSAEVYRLEALEEVFGSVADLEAETLGELVQTMGRNLATVWRLPETQKEAKTKRSDLEMQAEVFRGYEVARRVLALGLEKYPQSWELMLAQATIAFDQNTYQYELENRDTGFTTKRDLSFAGFQEAANYYAKSLPEMSEEKETSLPYEIWFYASLGSTDMAGLRDWHPQDPKQFPLIREAILALPGDAAERHMARFANSLNARIASIKAELKHRYLKAGLEIAGDHKQAQEARKVFQYYDDLVREIQLVPKIDGPDVVGHGQPFGLFVNLRHTKEIERESGGFGRYLQNQQNSGYYYYNYGRPQVNYRDKFEETSREALADGFEVLSVSFHNEKVESRGDAEDGWRITPYAYILLKARGPQVDQIPPLKMDLDFLDTSGYAVLPIATPQIPIDSRPVEGAPKPMQNLKIEQTLDERRADEGKLVLEVKARAHGLIPEFDEVLKLEPKEFEVLNVEDQGISIAELDAEADENAVITERSWLVEMQRGGDQEGPAKQFEFATAVVPDSEMVYQRYDDADLAEVSPVLALQAKYGESSQKWVWTLIGGIGVLGGIMGACVLIGRRAYSHSDVASEYRLPRDITPLSVMALLKRIGSEQELDGTQREELESDIIQLEKHYFSPEAHAETDLKAIAESWLERVA